MILGLLTTFNFVKSHLKLFLILGVVIIAIIIMVRVQTAFEQARRVPALIAYAEKLEAERALLIEASEKSQKPAEVANVQTKNNSDKLLATCLQSLRTSSTYCVPVSQAPSSSGAADRQQPGGVTSTHIKALEIECQSYKDDLNSAKTWGVEYKKYTKPE